LNRLERHMLESLIDLRENHYVVGIKAEFEAEGTRMEEALRLKEVITRAGLDLTIKIGGCEAIKDMYEARVIGVSKIVAPMIETPYALKKYVEATKLVFPDDEANEVKYLINIETITGYRNVSDMIESPAFSSIHGIVLGRVDMTGSLGMTREDINADEIFNIAQDLAQKALKHNFELVIGGGVSAQSLPFFKQLPPGSLSRFETRKVIFDAPKALKDPNADKGILKAVGFELMWLKNKRDFYGMIHQEDAKRIDMLESRYQKLIAQAGGISV
jgi:4-hydroxy-2-oxoheptanedioate aldolase